MPNYKSPDNSVHYLDSSEFEHLLPAGSVQITNEEAEALRPVPPAPTYQELRAAAYPAIADQLDAMWKGGEAAAAMSAVIFAVKAAIPKG